MDLMGILALDADQAKARGYGKLFEELRRMQEGKRRGDSGDHSESKTSDQPQPTED